MSLFDDITSVGNFGLNVFSTISGTQNKSKELDVARAQAEAAQKSADAAYVQAKANLAAVDNSNQINGSTATVANQDALNQLMRASIVGSETRQISSDLAYENQNNKSALSLPVIAVGGIIIYFVLKGRK